jgi:putative hemolysin
MKDKLIDKTLLTKVSPALGNPLIMKCVMKVMGLDKVNRLYDAVKHLEGTAIEDGMLAELGITSSVHHIDVLRRLEGKPFITISNHPYGHIDGIMLIGEIAKVRPDFKVMVNWMLGQIDIMDDHFIGVNPYSQEQVNKSSMSGVKECILHLENGHPLGLFPAGSVSKNIGGGQARDREWQAGVVKLIHKAGVPVIPTYISGQNSRFFNFLDHFPWWVRNIRLCHEFFTKQGKTIHLVFGEPIAPEKIEEFTDLKELGRYLQDETYRLADTIAADRPR